MESPFRDIIDGLYREARRTADDVGAERTGELEMWVMGRCERRIRGREEI
jgi:hypothetical protein